MEQGRPDLLHVRTRYFAIELHKQAIETVLFQRRADQRKDSSPTWQSIRRLHNHIPRVSSGQIVRFEVERAGILLQIYVRGTIRFLQMEQRYGIQSVASRRLAVSVSREAIPVSPLFEG